MLITDYLDQAVQKWPDKTAFVDEQRELTYSQLQEEAHRIAMYAIEKGIKHCPIIVFLGKGVECIAAFLGIAYSGNFYTPLDTGMPVQRIEKIIETLQPSAILTDREHVLKVPQFAPNANIFVYEEMQLYQADPLAIKTTVSRIIDTDSLYVMFTSGSTGMPKGVVISHRALVDFIEWGANCFHFDDSFVIGNQTPFYFSMSVFDIYQTIRSGGTMYIIPHTYFSFPVLLMQYLYDHHINTLNWVPSALTMVSALGALQSPFLPELRQVQFGGEVMPIKQLNRWRKYYPNVAFVNLYGPTEVTDTCTYYIVDRELEETELLPIGFACNNKDVFLLDEEDCLIAPEQIDHLGEICVRGTGLAYGYYRAPERTAENFIRNPLMNAYHEMIYRTGDLAKYNTSGELVYVSRKDFQIKHMGHRIELGEIETAASSVAGVEIAVCSYDSHRSRIVLFYTGTAEDPVVKQTLRALLPEYMLPGKQIHLEDIPRNLNGKVDRQALKNLL